MTVASAAITGWKRALQALAVSGAIACPGGARAAVGQPTLGTNLVMPLATSSPELRFHEGLIANNQPLIDTALPNVPGPVSGWELTQWNHDVYLRPADLRTLWSSAYGLYYEAAAADGESSLLIRNEAAEPRLVFTLMNSNGTVTSGGGRSLYLSANTLPGVNSGFDHEIDLSMDARIAAASVTYTTPTAKVTGAVLAMAYTGIGLMFTDPATRAQQFIFMQVGLTQSGVTSVTSGTICSGSSVILYAPPVAANQQLPFKTDTGALHHLTYNLTAAVQSLVGNPAPCGVGKHSWTPNMLNLANWKLTGTYMGSETENTDLRPGAVTNKAQGQVFLTLDLANFSIRRD